MKLHLGLIFFLASFREKVLRFYCSSFLPKCCVMLFLFIFNLSAIKAQNVIKVKKEEKAETFTPKGIYYSDPFTLSTGTAGEPPSDYKRMYLYIDEYNQTYIFHSRKKANKVISKFMKDPKKWTEETGKIEFSEGSVYMKTQGQFRYDASYRYYGELVSKNAIYLDYKATQNSKVGLSIYLHKYAK